MLPTDIFLFSSASSGGGVYTSSIFFSPSSQAKYLRVGDTIEDSVGNQYEVTTWAGYPSDASDGVTVTMQFITTDTLPVDSVSLYDGSAFTPGQDDVRPNVHTDGSISGASVFSGQNYEYTLSGVWTTSSEANKAVVGDLIIDKNGKAYEITFIDGASRFAVPFRAKEQEPEGIIPPDGNATLYSGTFGNKLFQGVNINKLAETAIRNRDTYILDKLSDFTETFTNVEGSTVTKAQIVYESSAGNFELARADDPLDPGKRIGIVADDSIANAASGDVYVVPGIKIFGFSGLTVTEPIYVSRTTAGEITQSLSGFTATDHVVRLGWAVSSQEILFMPEYDFEF